MVITEDRKMNYVSTRGGAERVSAAHAIKTGLASDGGLYMPEEIPTLTEDELAALCALSYPERAAAVLYKFLDGFEYEELLEDAEAAYSPEKFKPSLTPITNLGGGEYMLELWHGPTCAFKDMALQLMPRLFVRSQRKCGENRKALILVATSGDTGKAALEGYRDVPGTLVKVFFPVDGVSEVQKRQMQTQEGDNLSVDGIRGNFDDAQSGVKALFADGELREELDRMGIFLSSANSINWGRLVPQIVYYISAYCDLLRDGAIRMGELVDVTVPTGNFGNILACYIAKKMGLPIGRLVCASNRNDVLTEFFRTGTYNRCRPFHTTTSPSMDILISSNLERLLYMTLGAEKTAEYMKRLAEDGAYTLRDEDFSAVGRDFSAYSCDEEECARTVREIFQNKNCLIDTHTAVAVNCSHKYMNENKAERKMLAVSTASPYKFARDVYRAVYGSDVGDSVGALAALSSRSSVPVPEPLSALEGRPINHGRTIDKQDMKSAVREFAARA